MKNKQEQKARRKQRVRAKISGTATRPRLSVFRSLKHIQVQLIDDQHGKTLVAVTDSEVKTKKTNKVEIAKEVGKLVAQKAKEKKISQAVFDRAGYKYHGRVKALAEGAREVGLEF